MTLHPPSSSSKPLAWGILYDCSMDKAFNYRVVKSMGLSGTLGAHGSNAVLAHGAFLLTTHSVNLQLLLCDERLLSRELILEFRSFALVEINVRRCLAADALGQGDCSATVAFNLDLFLLHSSKLGLPDAQAFVQQRYFALERSKRSQGFVTFTTNSRNITAKLSFNLCMTRSVTSIALGCFNGAEEILKKDGQRRWW